MVILYGVHLPQRCSSELSPQSLYVSHRELHHTQNPLSQVNCEVEHDPGTLVVIVEDVVASNKHTYRGL